MRGERKRVGVTQLRRIIAFSPKMIDKAYVNEEMYKLLNYCLSLGFVEL